MNVTFTDLLGLLFIGLKLTHVIDWSWFWVCAPIWIPFVFVLFIELNKASTKKSTPN